MIFANPKLWFALRDILIDFIRNSVNLKIIVIRKYVLYLNYQFSEKSWRISLSKIYPSSNLLII
jgi:hypothetical protein